MINTEDIKKAIMLTTLGKYSEAEELYKTLLEKEPDNSVLLSAFGLFYINIGNYEKATEILHKSYLANKTFGTVSSYGIALFERGNFKDAGEILEESLSYGENIDIYNRLCTALFEVRNYPKAVKYADKMYELYPEDERAIANKIKALTQAGELLEAEELCVKTLKEHQNISLLWFQLGFLKELIYHDDKQALECYKIAKNLGNQVADYNIAVSYQKQGLYKEAEEYYQKMLSKFPNDKNTLTSYGMCLLGQKKFIEGSKLFFYRENSNIDKYSNNLYKLGDKLDDDLVILCDQGFGDNIMFIRYLPFLKDKNINVAVREPLIKIFRENYPDIKFVEHKDVNPDIQSIKLSDIAYILDMDFDNIPYAEGYLNLKAEDIKSDKLKVGLCWEAGAAGIRNMINRTINIRALEPIFNLENIQTYSFQCDDSFNGIEKFPQMIDLAKDFKDFYDTAKYLKAMDVVITVDTSVAHLAGALGVKTYLLLSKISDWRWFDDTKTTPWYNSVEIFKQTDNISWAEPINNIVKELILK